MSIQLPLARRDTIAERLAAGAAIVAADLAVEFEISEDAIRRDLRTLAAEGLCRRVYGGALPLTSQAQPMQSRVDLPLGRKRALARKASESILAGEFLFLDAGSTNLALAEYLPDDKELTVATNSIEIASALLRRPALRLIMIGGTVDPKVGACIDAAAVQAITNLNIDRCFFGAFSVDAERGIGAEVHADAVFKRALLVAAQHCVVIVTNEKLGIRARHRVCPLSDVGLLIAEHDSPAATVKVLKSAGATVARAAKPD